MPDDFKIPDQHRMDFFELAKKLARREFAPPVDDTYEARLRRMTIGDAIKLQAIYEEEA